MSLAPLTRGHRSKPKGSSRLIDRLRRHPEVTKIALGVTRPTHDRHSAGTLKLHKVTSAAAVFHIYHERGFTEVFAFSKSPQEVADGFREDA